MVEFRDIQQSFAFSLILIGMHACNFVNGHAHTHTQYTKRERERNYAGAK